MNILILILVLLFSTYAFAFDSYTGQIKEKKENNIIVLIDGHLKKIKIDENTICHKLGYHIDCKKIVKGDTARLDCKNDECYRIVVDSERR
jgi:hypothetical protein